jgi:hypothetical protein
MGHSAHNGTLDTGVTWETSERGTAAKFDGTDYAKITLGSEPVSGQTISVSAWVYSEETSGVQAIYCSRQSGFPDSKNYLTYNAGGPNFGWDQYHPSGGGTYSGTISDARGRWVHVVATQDATTSKIYVDGELKGSAASETYSSTAGAYYIGYRYSAQVMTGSIQNLRVWDRVLSADEALLLYERPWEGIEYGDTFHYDPPAPASMLPLDNASGINTSQELWLPLTDGSGTTATDISGNSYTGTARSSQGWATTLLGTAADNDSLTNGGFTYGDQSGLDMYGDKSFSLWVKPNGGSATQVLFEKRSSSGGLEGYSCYVRYNTDSTVGFLADSGSSTTTASSASALVTDVWSNVCVVVSGNNATIYVNGVAGTTVTNADFAADLSNTVDYVTGYAQRDPSTQDDFDGSMQNVRVWSRALTADEVWSIYSNPWLGSNYKLASGSTPLYNYIFRTERFRRLG